MKNISLWDFQFCPLYNLYNVFFLMSFFLAEKYINKNRVKKKKVEVGRAWELCHKWLQMEEKYQFHISSWRENGNLKIMFTNFPFVPTVNKDFCVWLT